MVLFDSASLLRRRHSFQFFSMGLKKVVGIVGVIGLLVVAALYLRGGGKEGAGVPPEYRFEFLTAREQVDGIPRMSVQIWTGNTPRSVGTFEGSCAASKEDLLPGEIEKVVCWYAGGGSEIGIFSEQGEYVVKVGSVDEGSSETAGFRGAFKNLFSL